MRAISLVNRLELDFSGNVSKNAIALGDVDNDGMHELVIGNQIGEIAVFKGSSSKPWCKANDLGMITAIGIGDIFNLGLNSLVVINGEGWCFVFDFPNNVKLNENQKPVHVQRIPANVKVLLLSDVNADGLVELVIALTDRVVRTYQWAAEPSSRLVAINKWEFANQIGTVTLNNMADGVPSLLVAHPGGTFIRLKCRPVEETGSDKKEEEEYLSKMSIDFHPLASSHARNPNVSTEILGNISQGKFANPRCGSLYAVATLDGTLMLVQDEQILWNIQVDHQLFSISKLDVTGDEREEVIACSWDGQTYIINQERQSVRFQFDYPVSTFCAGHFSLNSSQCCPVFVYATFHNKIYVYYDINLPRITLQSLTDVMEELKELKDVPECYKNLGKQPQQLRELVSSVLYGD